MEILKSFLNQNNIKYKEEERSDLFFPKINISGLRIFIKSEISLFIFKNPFNSLIDIRFQDGVPPWAVPIVFPSFDYSVSFEKKIGFKKNQETFLKNSCEEILNCILNPIFQYQSIREPHGKLELNISISDIDLIELEHIENNNDLLTINFYKFLWKHYKINPEQKLTHPNKIIRSIAKEIL